jgi:uncharacterized protein HemX
MNESTKYRYRRIIIALAMLAIAGAGGNVFQYLFWTGRSRAASERFAAEQRGLETTIADIERERQSDGERIERLEAIQRNNADTLSSAAGILAADDGRLSSLTDILRRVREAVKVLETRGVYRDTGGDGY